MSKFVIVPHGFSRRSRVRGLRHFRVAQEIARGAFESVCHHGTRARAEQCRDRRMAVSGASCIDHAPAATPRITMPLADYLSAGRTEPPSRACFACGRVAIPMPITKDDPLYAQELRCGLCNAAAAVDLQQAVKERWLRVMHSGQVQNDEARVV